MKIEEHRKGKTIKFEINNMVCNSCEKIIEKSLNKMHGIYSVTVSYSSGEAEVIFNPNKISVEEITEAINKAGYTANPFEGKKKINFAYIVLGIAGAFLLVLAYLAISSTLGQMNISIPQLDAQTSLILIFIVGLLTGFHCIGMCGSFVLGYTAKARKENPKSLNLGLHAQYAFGKIISYTLIGGIFGVIGSLFVFTPTLRAGIAIVAGIFLIVFGLKLLNIFPILRKFSLPQGLFDKLKIGPLKSGNSDPIIVGLMNGLFIACGPLQAMYIVAATTGSFFAGGMILLAFAIGTLIPMMFFGAFASFLSHGFQNSIVRVSAVIVIIMGLLMINNGLALTGNAINSNSIGGLFSSNTQNPGNSNVVISDANYSVDSPYQIIRMDVTSSGWSPNSFVLKKGVPVKWIINGKQLNGCNNAINVPAYNLSFNIKQGEQTIEFTPTQTGVIQWSCWMGMIQGTFVVRDDVGVDSTGKVVLSASTQTAVTNQIAATPKKTGGCGCGGGSSGTPSCH
jgi:sulfite exporter TauE/SafE/copper chaperone CopZ